MNKKVMYGLLALLALLLLCYCSSSANRMTIEPSNASRFSVYGTMRCGYTVKMLDYLKEMGQSVRFVDVSLPEGDAEFKNVTEGKNIRGIPFTVDHKTGDTIAGFQKKIIL